MEYTITLPESQKDILVSVDRKKMKTCRLKVFPSGEVRMSVPQGATDEWVLEYLSAKSSWVEKKLVLFNDTSNYSSTSEIRNGMSIKVLGQDWIFSIRESDKEYIFAENKLIHIGCENPKDENRILKIFEKWWRKEAMLEYQRQLEKLYPIVGKYDIQIPRIFVKKMRTLWGSCSSKRSIIYINMYLYKARPACIEYVILHELVHFIYPNHGKSFYAFLSSYMPDWKDRKRILDFDVVHGL